MDVCGMPGAPVAADAELLPYDEEALAEPPTPA